MSFNRPSSERRGIEVPGFVKPAIDYGSVSGTGAKFIGQGILNLYRDPRITWPFTPTFNGDQLQITAGHVNGVPIPRFSGTITPGYYKAVITTDGQVVTSALIEPGSPDPQTPQEGAYPTTVEVPVCEVEPIPNTNNTAHYARRMTGAGGITMIPYAAAYAGEGCSRAVMYAWAIFA